MPAAFDFLDLGVHEEQIRDLIARLNDIRAALGRDDADTGQLQEALLLELENTAESMQSAREELRAASEQLADRQLGEERERHLLRAVYGGMPAGVVLLDENLRIRRVNEQAARDLGTSPSYVAGRPFTVFVALPDRAAFRARFATARRDGTPVRFPARLLSRGQERPVTLALAITPVTHQHDEAIVLVIEVTGDRHPPALTEPARDTAEELPDGAAPGLLAKVATQLDLVTDLAQLLLGHAISEDGSLLDAAARFLAAGLADWVVVDLVRTGGLNGDSGGLARSAVVGPGDARGQRAAAVLADAAPDTAPLVREVLKHERPADQVLVADQAAFGTDKAGVPLLTQMDAHSVACFPLSGDGGALGAVTAARVVGSPPFDFAELALLERLVNLIALALRQLRLNRRQVEQVRTLRLAVQPGTLPRFRGTELACAYRPPASGEAVGRQFADAFEVAGEARQVMLVAGQIPEAAPVAAKHAEAAILAWHAVRLYGSAGLPTAEVLGRTRDVLRVQAADDPSLSLALARIRADGDRLVADLVSAGSPAALLLRQAGPVQPVGGGGSPLAEDAEPAGGDVRTDTIVLEPGDVLLLHSGIVGADSPDAGAITLNALAALLAGLAGEPADRVVAALDRELEAAEPPDAGCALVAVRALPASPT